MCFERVDSMNVTLTLATIDEKPILQNLLSLYIHDLSAYSDDLHPNEEGRFDYDGLDLYWEEASLFPFLVRVEDRIAGFLLLNRPPYAPRDVQYLINEVFILKSYRGTGVGKEVVRHVFDRYPGRYLVLELERNTPAIAFWQRTLQGLGIAYDEAWENIHGDRCLTQRFTVE